MRRALVTGASSAQGQHVIGLLLDAGWEVTATSRRQPPIVHERYRWHLLDLADDRYRFGLVNAIGGRQIDLVVHCAPPRFMSLVQEHVGHLIHGGVMFSGDAWLSLHPDQVQGLVDATA